MSIIIRLQNLPWSANSVDIRRFFSGLSIPEGGVHIVGGEMGDAFIAFSTDEDARLAMAKDGGKIKDMQIKLLLSSRTEMMRVIEQARQQNMVVTQPHIVTAQPPPILSLQQPTRTMTPTSESDRRRGRSPSPHRRSRDRSPGRDRRRSPDDRRGSKRDRSRSPSRSSRSFSRDMDRRGDRFKRDDRRYDDSRYRDERRSSRSSPHESKKYPDADHVNSRSQLLATEGFRDMQPSYDQPSNVAMAGLFSSYTNQHSHPVLKSFPDTYSHAPPDSSVQFSPAERLTSHKPAELVSVVGQKNSSTTVFPHEQMSFRSQPFEQIAVSSKENSMPPIANPQIHKQLRRTRFESEFISPPTEPHFTPETSANVPVSESQHDQTKYNGGRPPPESYSESRGIWQREMPERSDNESWNDKRQALLNPPISKNGDFLQVVPMDLDPSPSELTPEKEIYHETSSPRAPSYVRNNASPRNDDSRRDQPNRIPPPMHNEMQGRGSPSLTVEVRGLPPDARIDDILDLFHGIPLPAANVRIEASDQGFEKAYIRFVSVSDFEEALNRNRHFMREGRCELVPCPAAAFDSAPRPQKSKPKPKPREEDLVIQVRGLPFSCKEDDVVRFFDGLGILDLYVDIAADGRASGIGFVEFGTPEDFRAALAMNGKMIGHRYITVSVASKEMMAFARGEEFDPMLHSKDLHMNMPHSNNRPYIPPSNQSRAALPNQNRPPINESRQPPGSNQARPPPGSNQTRQPLGSNQVRQPPGSNQSRQPPGNNQSHQLLGSNQGRQLPPSNHGRQPAPGTQTRPPQPLHCIAMKNLPEGVTNRDIADFLGQVHVIPRAIHIMLRPDKTPSGDAFAEFINVADMEAALELNGRNVLGKRVVVQHISFHEMSEILGRPGPLPPPPTAPGALLRTPGDVDRPRRPLLPQAPNEGQYRERPRMEPPIRGGRPGPESFNRKEGPPSRPPFGPGRMRAPWPNRAYNQESRFPTPPADRGAKDFGSPGCVVSINNLHFRAGLEELLDFFRDYRITKDNIIRKYNENGQTTGEARVAFQNSRDAQRAVRELNQKPIMGRSLTLSIL